MNLSCRNIIGLNLAKEMCLVKNVNNISSKNLFKEYSDTFSGLGLLENKCRLRLKEDVKPTVDAPRKIPFSLQER